MLAVGSPDGMTIGNTSATYTPDGGAPIPVQIRSIFNLYPDKTSPAWVKSDAVNVENQTGHGPWTTMIALDLPSSLPEGPGAVRISTSAAYPPSPARDINDAVIGLDILPAAAGPGAAATFTYEIAANVPVAGDLSLLEPGRRLVIKPAFTGPASTTYGAIEIRLKIPGLSQLNDTSDFRIVVDDKIRSGSNGSQLQYFWSVNGDDLVVSFISPVGGLAYSQAYCYLVSANLMVGIDAGLINVNAINPSVTYYDVNGNVVTGGDSFVIIDET
jgi:hypothetical protein